MTVKFQAGVGPGQNSCHIYRINLHVDATRMALCERVVIARNYKGALSISNSKLCRRCFKLAENMLPKGAALNAEILGVASIED